MPCFKPLKGYRRQPSPDFPRGGFTSSRQGAFVDQPLSVPCGQCIGCKLERSREWAIRCMHEASMHEQNCFVTLTYEDEHLPENGQLVRSDYQKFMKRLRKRVPRVRNYYCGEYGDTTERPHFHALLFGWKPSDGQQLTTGNNPLFESETLNKTWSLGLTSFGEVTFESAAYVARYCTKKITGPMADDHYARTNPDTGEIYFLIPPFNGMSLKPGIGNSWLQKWGPDAYEKDQIIMRGKAMKPPRSYDRIFEHVDPHLFLRNRAKRGLSNAKHLPHNRDPNETYKGSFNHFKAQTKIAEQKLQERDQLK